MKNNIEETMKKVISEKEMPQEKRNNLRVQIFINFLLAIFIIIYFAILIFGSRNALKEKVIEIFYSFSLIFLLGAIALFEVAYRKDNGKLAFNGIEMLAVALITLVFPYSVFELSEKYKKYIYFVVAYVATYYIIKSIVMYIMDKRKYKKEKLGDIKEILEPIEQERRESLKKVKQKELAIEQTKPVKKRENSKKTEQKNETVKTETKIEKKRGRPKKIEDEKETLKKEIKIKEEIETKTTKKRGRPKKNIEEKKVEKEVENKEIKKRGRPKKSVQEETPKETNSPKKRGRPRKVN